MGCHGGVSRLNTFTGQSSSSTSYSHFSRGGMTYFYVVQYVMITYLYVFLGYCMAPDYKKLMESRRWVCACLVIIFGIAVVCEALTYNIIASNITDSTIWTTERADTERGFRVTSTQGSPNIFGYVNVLLAILILNIKDKTGRKYLMFAMILVDIVLCGTRAPIFGLASSVCIYALFASKGKLVRAGLFGLLTIVVAVNFIDSKSPAMKLVNGVVDIFTTGGENTGGSSVDLRERQFAVAMILALDNPIWGSGQGFCSAMQNEESSMHIYYDQDLYGAESVIFYMFIDYGFVYTGLIIIYYLSYILFFMKNLRGNKDILMLAIPALVALLTHLLTSRPDNSWQIFMPLMGACMYMLQSRKALRTYA